MTVRDNQSLPMVELRGIAKSFGATKALQAVNLKVLPGTVHTVLGENGSGKSTLVKVLSGVVTPDSGEIQIDGNTQRLPTPKSARDAGIYTVFQEVLVAPNRTISENVLLGSDGLFRHRWRGAERTTVATAALSSVSTLEFDSHAECRSLNLMQQHQVAIARAAVHSPKLLILDESTAALDIVERDKLFDFVRSLTAQGSSVMFISHRLDEVMEISDQVTVLRSGQLITTLEKHELSERRLLTFLNPDADPDGNEGITQA